jgi:hypothetical protein
MQEVTIREFERHIQVMRKEMGLRKVEKIEIGYDALPEISSVIEANESRIRKDVNAHSIRQKVIEGAQAKQLDLDGVIVNVSVKRVEHQDYGNAQA